MINKDIDTNRREIAVYFPETLGYDQAPKKQPLIHEHRLQKSNKMHRPHHKVIHLLTTI